MDLRERPFELTEEQIEWVETSFRAMSLEQKAGQLFCILGNSYSKEERKYLVGKMGIGAVLFRPAAREKIKVQFEELEKCASIPLLKAANLEEGGAGILTDGTYFGSQLQTAAAGSVKYAEYLARTGAAEGREVGVNWSFSPVADIDYNYRNPITNMRTFGSDSDVVLKYALAYTEEMQRLKVAAAAKHFPGDGMDYRDQHLHPTYNTLDIDSWFFSYGKIYQSLIDGGILSIMAGHIVQPSLVRMINPQIKEEECLPASLSKEVLTGILREKMGFNGVIISDATIMGGYTMAMERKKAIPTSIQAGCDMLCFSMDIYEDLEHILNGIKMGILTEERLDEAVKRILALKAKVARNENDIFSEKSENIRGKVTREKVKQWRKECSGRAVTLVKDIQTVIPVTHKKFSRIRLVLLGENRMHDGTVLETAETFFREKGFETEIYEPFQDDLHGSKHLPTDRLTLLLLHYPAESNRTAVRIAWCPKHAMEIPRFIHEEATIAISFANPYHLQDIPRVQTYINSYCSGTEAVKAALERLIGEETFTGINPVDPFCGLTDTRL